MQLKLNLTIKKDKTKWEQFYQQSAWLCRSIATAIAELVKQISHRSNQKQSKQISKHKEK